QVGSQESQAGRQNAVENSGRATALDVTQDDRASLDADPSLDFFCDELAHASLTEDHVSECIDRDVLGVGVRHVHAFGSDHEAPLTAALPLADEVAAHLLQIESEFRKENPVGARGNAA